MTKPIQDDNCGCCLVVNVEKWENSIIEWENFVDFTQEIKDYVDNL